MRARSSSVGVFTAIVCASLPVFSGQDKLSNLVSPEVRMHVLAGSISLKGERCQMLSRARFIPSQGDLLYYCKRGDFSLTAISLYVFTSHLLASIHYTL